MTMTLYHLSNIGLSEYESQAFIFTWSLNSNLVPWSLLSGRIFRSSTLGGVCMLVEGYSIDLGKSSVHSIYGRINPIRIVDANQGDQEKKKKSTTIHHIRFWKSLPGMGVSSSHMNNVKYHVF